MKASLEPWKTRSFFPRCEIFSGTDKTQGTDGEWQKEMRERKKREIERE